MVFLIDILEKCDEGRRHMKKGWVYFFLISLFFFFDQTKSEATSNTKIIPIAINDKLITFPDELPFVQDQTTFIPIRFFSDAIGATITLDNKVGTLTLTTQEKSLSIDMKKKEIETSEGEKTKINLFLKNGRNYASVRILGEYFGYEVQYQSKGPIVRLVNSKAQLSTIPFFKENQKEINDFYQKVKLGDRPKVYLTFDDGPILGINEILNILKKKKAKASFFMIETQMTMFPNETKRLVKEGHYPALHSVSHNKKLLYEGSSSAVAKEMLKTQQTLFNLTGIQSKLTRAPYGSKPYMKNPFRDELVRNGFKMWDWSIDSEDWRYHRTNPKEIVKIVKDGIQKQKKQKDPIVILFHINKGTAAVLPEIIDYIYSQGFQCVAYNPTKHFVMNFWEDERL